jgi:hypothetical protein
MTAVTPSDTPQISRTRYLPLAIGASVVHLLMMIPGYSEDGSFQTGDWLMVLAISMVVGVLVFMFVVPRAGDTAGMVLGAVALVSVLVFWAGLTLPLAAAAGVVGWRAKQAGQLTVGAKVTLALAAVSVVALVAIIIGDAVAN